MVLVKTDLPMSLEHTTILLHTVNKKRQPNVCAVTGVCGRVGWKIMASLFVKT